MSIKRIGIILLSIFIGLYLFFAVFPVMMMSPASLYYIKNADEMTHNIMVEIFDENNLSVFMKNYTLGPEESVSIDRKVNWHLPLTSSFITWSDGVYFFNFTVDNNVSKEYIREVNMFESISVRLYTTDYSSSEIIPIEIKITTL